MRKLKPGGAKNKFMRKIALIEVSDDLQKSSFLTDIKLAQVPTTKDRVVVNIDDTGHVFEVVETHFGGNWKVDVFVKRLCTITDYWVNRRKEIAP